MKKCIICLSIFTPGKDAPKNQRRLCRRCREALNLLHKEFNPPVYTKITVVKCSCGHPNCSVYTLQGIGMFYQGSGFTKQDAELIARLVNNYRGIA
jgi:hypothetical protein